MTPSLSDRGPSADEFLEPAHGIAPPDVRRRLEVCWRNVSVDDNGNMGGVQSIPSEFMDRIMDKICGDF